MTTFQRVVKYLAIALAAIIIVNIFSAIFFGIYHIGYIFGDDNEKITKVVEKKLNNKNNISVLDIKLKYTELEIKNGSEFRIKTNNKNIQIKENYNEISIEEKGKSWNLNNKNKKLIIYLPNTEFDKIDIEAGAGKIDAESITTSNFELEIGAGKTEFDKLNVLHNAKIDGGVGSTKILDGSINNLDLEMGVGEFVINSKLIGNNTIETGVGSLNINLLDSIKNYSMKVEKGIGSIRINGEKISNDTTYGEGSNLLSIEGGVGDINIKTK